MRAKILEKILRKLYVQPKKPTCIKNYTIDSKSSQTTSFFISYLIFRSHARWIQRCEKEEIVIVAD